MNDPAHRRLTAFRDSHRLATGAPVEVALAVKRSLTENPTAPVLTFDDASGGVVDLDLSGDDAAIKARLDQDAATPADPARGRGRPKLGVVAREVTLLPRHWDWLAAQPGGASQTLRRLIEAARRADDGPARRKAAQAVAYRFMSAMAGNLPGFEEAIRALFAADAGRFAACTAAWPEDVRDYAQKLAADGLSAG